MMMGEMGVDIVIMARSFVNGGIGHNFSKYV
jgi:hypothetical protein